MDVSKQFIKDIKFDEEKRILIAVQPQYQSYLQEQKRRQMLKKYTTDVLKDKFIKLEISKTGCRITVKPGTEDKSLELVKTELVKGLNMAMKYLNLMGK